MKYIYAVCRDQGGAHESDDVLAIFSEEKKAQKICDEQNEKLQDTRFTCEVVKWEINKISDTEDILNI